MTDVTIDPYGAFQESWPVSVLDAASQNATIAFTHMAIRPMPKVNQITFPDVAHYEICGFDVLTCAAYAVGYIEDVNATLTAVLADARSLGYNPALGSDLTELVTLARRQNWDVESVVGMAGDVATQLTTEGLVGITALNTAYGTGAQWNVLHPQAGGPVGHWEGIGAVLTQDGAMTQDQFNQLCGQSSFFQYVIALGRVPESTAAWQARADRVSQIGFVSSLWEMTGSPEGMSTGGIVGKLGAVEAQVAVLDQHLSAVSAATAAPASGGGGIPAYDPAPARAAIANMKKELADLHATLAAAPSSKVLAP